MMKYEESFDVIVVGGGHAGTEAALAAARMGANTLLLTHNIATVGEMSCNPAIGGIGKGHLVKEIDAMGGAIGRAADAGGIQFRILNRSKGPAVRATRAQADRVLYKQAIRAHVENQPNLRFFQQAVDDLIVEGQAARGVVTQGGIRFYAKAVVLTTGTFLGGKIHIGDCHYAGGRAGDPPAIALAHRLRELPFNVGRLKTGTPPRIDGSTIDFSTLEAQKGDEPTPYFSFFARTHSRPQQISCYITHTNSNTHDIIRQGLHRSPLFSGIIEGIGPRYCPSIEDKVVRFSERNAHQIFLEPEGLNTREVYPNGISTSLPFDVQCAVVRSIRGLENAHITRAGYAIEYDFFDPKDLSPSLETKALEGLFFAGQINGTTGYEEAAAQGLLAGINAACRALEQEPWRPGRSECYLGVLVDDLITLGTQEPYRMFTSRAEYRLTLREDNADFRLTPIARKYGLISDADWQQFEEKMEAIERETQRLQDLWIRPNTQAAQYLETVLNQAMAQEARSLDLLKRPEIRLEDLLNATGTSVDIHPSVAEQIEVRVKYAGYISAQEKEVARNARYEALRLPKGLHYAQVSGLSNEILEKLTRIRPETIGQAARIPGVTPAAISLILVHLKKRGHLDDDQRTLA